MNEECTCICHQYKMMHIVPCCGCCKHCKKNIRLEFYDSHLLSCSKQHAASSEVDVKDHAKIPL